MTTKNKKITALVFCVIIFLVIAYFFIYNATIKNLWQLANIYKNGKHLVLFQNNAELRPTGGFLGSFAVIDTKNFIITNMYFESNIYKRDNEFVYKNNYTPKDEVLKNFVPNQKLAMRDSNWSVDFSRAAYEIAWFYENEGGQKVDTVTAINTEFFKKILDIIGPIKMVKYGIEVNSQNFNEIVQNEVENVYQLDKDNYAVSEPKSILSEMMPYVLSRIKSINYGFNIIKSIPQLLQNKEILIASTNPNHQNNIISNNWGGSILDNSNIYLYLNNANLGSNKSSLYVHEDINYNLKKDIDNNLFALLEINRSYPMQTNCKNNINFSQVLIPENSELIHVKQDDLDITDQSELIDIYDHKNIRLWTNVDCGHSIKYQFKYTIAKNIASSNQIIIQKQSGAVNQYLKVYYEDELLFEGDFEKDLFLYLPISS